MNMEQLNLFADVTKLAPPIALALCLNVLGYCIKRIKRIPNNLIPIILAACGGVAFPFIAERGDISPAVTNPAAMNAIYGICIGGLSVSFNQIWRILQQFRSRDKGDTKTSIPNSASDGE